jgi:hypothetical protein
MLYNIVLAVIALSFILAILLEASIIFVVLQANPESPKKTVPKPRKLVLKRRESKERKAQMKKFETLLNNIDAYDGTDFGQKDIE